MKLKLIHFFTALILVSTTSCTQQLEKVEVAKENDGFKLKVNNKSFFVNGINWDYVPIGTTITDVGIWNKSDTIIKKALDAEMSLLKEIGINTIRVYNMKPKWIEYIYKTHGIYTMLNITFGAYGLSINNKWVPKINYSDKEAIAVLLQEAKDMANTYKVTPGLLLYMIGNENNYHLSWSGAATENIPVNSTDKEIKIAARALYKVFNSAAKVVKEIDKNHPVAICNGDLLYSDIFSDECKDVDIFGVNMYRGTSFGDAFKNIKRELNKPVLFTEFGSDAFNAKTQQEDQKNQSKYLKQNWKEIYENAAGLGKAENSLGGFTFQSSDGWWKYSQTTNLKIHDTNASWANGGYKEDFVEGKNNMNEEWFGICAKGPTNKDGLYNLKPRGAYYVLKEVHKFNPFETENINKHFKNINIEEALKKAQTKQ